MARPWATPMCAPGALPQSAEQRAEREAANAASLRAELRAVLEARSSDEDEHQAALTAKDVELQRALLALDQARICAD